VTTASSRRWMPAVAATTGGGQTEATNREPEAGEGKTEEAGRLGREFRVPSGRRWARQCPLITVIYKWINWVSRTHSWRLICFIL